MELKATIATQSKRARVRACLAPSLPLICSALHVERNNHLPQTSLAAACHMWPHTCMPQSSWQEASCAFLTQQFSRYMSPLGASGRPCHMYT